MKIKNCEISFDKFVAILSAVSFLTFVQVAMTAFAGEGDLWVKNNGSATETGKPESSETAAARKLGEEAGKTVDSGLSLGTIGFSAAMIAGTIAIGISTLGGGTSAVRH